MKTSADYKEMIHQNWRCVDEDCTNFGVGHCWVHPATKKYYKIEVVDVESWAFKIPGGIAWLN